MKELPVKFTLPNGDSSVFPHIFTEEDITHNKQTNYEMDTLSNKTKIRKVNNISRQTHHKPKQLQQRHL